MSSNRPSGTGTSLHQFPGTSCLFSVISKSSSSSSSFSVGRAVSQDGIALAGEGNRREVRLALTTRTTAENDDDDEKDWEMTLNRDGTSCLATIVLSLRDKNHSPIEAPSIKLVR